MNALPADLKRDMRQAMMERRAVASRATPDAALKLRDLFLKNVVIDPGAVIAAYSAMGDEMTPAPLVDALRTMGHAIALPVVLARHTPLIFRLHKPGDAMASGSMGIAEPLATALVVEPDVLLVPLLAFDHRGYRLGYGAGYYDRTLSALRTHKKITAIGIAFSAQQVEMVPTTPHDAKLDKIVTEIQVLSP